MRLNRPNETPFPDARGLARSNCGVPLLACPAVSWRIQHGPFNSDLTGHKCRSHGPVTCAALIFPSNFEIQQVTRQFTNDAITRRPT